MAASLTSEAILFAINAALRLGRNVQRAYANSIRSKELVLPLPAFNDTPTLLSAQSFFNATGEEGGQQFLPELEDLQELHEQAQRNALSPHRQQDYLGYYAVLYRQVRFRKNITNAEQGSLDNRAVLALLRVRQWERGKRPEPSALQLVAGTMVELGIDYFSQVPGALNTESALGGSLRAFLDGVDQINISEITDFDKALAEDIIPSLFIGAIEGLGELSVQLSNDPKFMAFVRACSEGISRDVLQRAERGDANKESVQWSKLVLTSTIRHAGNYITQNPQAAFDLNDGSAALIQQTGAAFLSLIIDEDSDTLTFRRALTADGLDRLIGTTLSVIARQPGIITGERGLQHLIVDLSRVLQQTDLQQEAVLHELLRLSLETAAGHLSTLWTLDEEDLLKLPRKALQELLLLLAERNDTTSWKPKLRGEDFLFIAEQTLDLLVTQPNLLTQSTEQGTLLGDVVRALLRALSQLPPQHRLRRETLADLIDLTLRVVAQHPNLLQRIQVLDDDREASILSELLDIILQHPLRGNPAPTADIDQQLCGLLLFVMDEVVAKYPDRRGLVIVKVLLQTQMTLSLDPLLTAQRSNQLLGALLLLVEEHPQVISRDEELIELMRELAAVLRQPHVADGDLKLAFSRILLEKTTTKLSLLDTAQNGQQLLVVALQHILAALAPSDLDVQFKLEISRAELLRICSELLDEVIEEPDWIYQVVRDRPILRLLLDEVLQGLQSIPEQQRMHPELLRAVLETSLSYVLRSPQLLEWLDEENDSRRRSLLGSLLGLLAKALFDAEQPAILNGRRLYLQLLDYFLVHILEVYPDRRGLLIVSFLVQELRLLSLQDQEQRVLADDLREAVLLLLDAKPELLTRDLVFQRVLQAISDQVEQLQLAEPRLRIKMLIITLHVLQQHLHLLVKTGPDSFENVLVELLRQLSAVLDRKVRQELELSDAEILRLAEQLLFYVSEQPAHIHNQLVRVVLAAVVDTLRQRGTGRDIPLRLLIQVIERLLALAYSRESWLIKISPVEEQQVLPIAYLLEWLLEIIYKQSFTVKVQLLEDDRLDLLLEYYLSEAVQLDPVTVEAIDAIALQLNSLVNQFANGLISLSEFDDRLDMIS